MEQINILFIGDIVGKPGLQMLQTWLPTFRQKYKADITIVNGENAADGKGITPKEGEIIFSAGADVITGGNHTWEKFQAPDYLKTDPRVLRPQNYPRGTHGSGHYVFDTKKGKVAVFNLQGRAFLPAIDCPFRSAEWLISKVKGEAKVIFLDFHAEATAEKIAMANFLDGKVSAMVGTHTHIQTADERIFPNGLGYITDVGMTGPYDSVIGMKIQPALNRFIYQTPQKYETAQNDPHISGMYFRVDAQTGKTVYLERIFFPDFTKEISNG